MSNFITLMTLFLSTSFSINANESVKKNEIINFDSIRSVIQNDQLDKELKKKQLKQKKIRSQKLKSIKAKYNIPPENEIWTFLTEYWLVKNAQELQWDFQKPDYGLDKSFKTLLENLGYYEKKFKIILVNTPNVPHFGLPGDLNESIFLLSVPFVRTLDLSKVEISLLMLEDYFRLENKYLENAISIKGFNELLGTNYYGKKMNKEIFNQLIANYSNFVYKTGFNFEQQYAVTTKMGRVLKSNLNLWNTYVQMLKKVDTIIKTNVLFKDHNKLYPSPEVQINWLTK